MTWTRDREFLLKEFSDKAQGLRWMHLRAARAYRKLQLYFVIPTICLTTLSGVLTYQANNDSSHSTMVLNIAGALSVFAALLNTVSQFMKIAEKAEGHRLSELNYGKFYRNIRLLLTTPIEQRPEAHTFLQQCKEELDRLCEFAPPIPQKVVLAFMIEVDHNDPELILPENASDLKATPLPRYDVSQFVTRETQATEPPDASADSQNNLTPSDSSETSQDQVANRPPLPNGNRVWR